MLVRTSLLVTSLLLAAASGTAGPLQTIPDVYCGAAGHGSCSDVIGERADFDIDKITVEQLAWNDIQVQILFNYHGGDAVLSAWDDGTPHPAQLVPGDLLLGIQAGSQHVYRWGVALADLGRGLTPGQLYRLEDNGYFESDHDMPGNPGQYYIWRYHTPTRIGPSKVTGLVGAGTSSTARFNEHEVLTTLRFAPGDTGLVAEGAAAGALSIHFAAASCANDVLDGSISVHTPEPNTYFLMGAALLLLAGVARRCAVR